MTAPLFIAADTFNRTVTGGLGAADVGGPWTAVGSTSRLSVSSGQGNFRHDAAGNQDEANLLAVTSSDTDLRGTVVASAPATGGGLYLYISPRRVDTINRYDARLRFLVGDKVAVALSALKGSTTATTLSKEITLPGTFPAGTKLNVRVVATGIGTTTLRVKVWPTGTAEPTTWLLEQPDTYTGLQVPGAVGVRTYLSATATTIPFTLGLSDLQVRSATP